jgi:hypothetical protein
MADVNQFDPKVLAQISEDIRLGKLQVRNFDNLASIPSTSPVVISDADKETALLEHQLAQCLADRERRDRILSLAGQLRREQDALLRERVATRQQLVQEEIDDIKRCAGNEGRVERYRRAEATLRKYDIATHALISEAAQEQATRLHQAGLSILRTLSQKPTDLAYNRRIIRLLLLNYNCV